MDEHNTYDQEISKAMHYRCWLDIKSCLKLNSCHSETKRGDDKYNPTQKYWQSWDALTHNMNLIILTAGKDATQDEITWPNSSYANTQNKYVNKKCNKGGQHIMLLDARHR